MRIGLRCEEAGNPARIRALRQLVQRTGIEPGAWCPTGEGAASTLAWTRRPMGTPRELHLPQRLSPGDRGAWLVAVREFLFRWKSEGLRPEALFRRGDDSAAAGDDLPTLALGLLDQWDESFSDAGDEHGRFPASSSVLGEAGLLDVPVVDRIAAGVAAELSRLSGQPRPPHAVPWGLAVTFDIDSEGMYRGSSAYRCALAAAQAGPRTAARFAARGALVSARVLPDPHLDLRGLCQVVEGLDARATFFAQTHRGHTLDSYELGARSPLPQVLRRVLREGHEVGLHSSYATGAGGPSLAEQASRLRARTRGTARLHRAHYLRGTLSAPWRSERIVDSSLAYGSRTGFRLGTMMPFTLAQGAFEAPPCAMDTTLRRDDGLSPRGAVRRVLSLAREARRNGGLVTVIWHPHNLEPVLWPGWLAVLVEVITEVRHAGGLVGPLGAMSKPWRAHEAAIGSILSKVAHT